MRQKLGQHFLNNPRAIQKIVSALDLQKTDLVVEIGPGRGALTFPLLKKCRETDCRLIAVEKDLQLAKNLETGIKNREGEIKIIAGDILEVLPKITADFQPPAASYKIVGNIPYYLTGKLLRILGELDNKPELAVLMLQKEVAERISGKPPAMNLLAAAVQFWSVPKIIFSLKPGDFRPPPEVESAVLKLKTLKEKIGPEIASKYYQLLRLVFKQPRKTLLNNLKAVSKAKTEIEIALKTLKIDPQSRPQNLSLIELKKLASTLL